MRMPFPLLKTILPAACAAANRPKTPVQRQNTRRAAKRTDGTSRRVDSDSMAIL